MICSELCLLLGTIESSLLAGETLLLYKQGQLF
jgi:hypothetical protein